MKNYPTFILAAFAMFFCCRSHSNDAVAKANHANPDNPADKFLVSVTDTRLMDIREAEEAAKKGTTAEIREYGQLMLHDQKLLLEKITAIASERNIQLPQDIGSEKMKGFKALDKKQGKEFDEKFISMMTIDHERDIREFKSAQKFKDSEVRDFATANIALIEAHLAKIKAIKKENN